jgi:hypothetical protein
MDVLLRGILLTGETMKSFLERLAARDELGRVGGRRSFRDLGMGETAALSLSKGMRRGQGSPVNKPLKKQAREPWNERKGFMVFAYFNWECLAELRQ